MSPLTDPRTPRWRGFLGNAGAHQRRGAQAVRVRRTRGGQSSGLCRRVRLTAPSTAGHIRFSTDQDSLVGSKANGFEVRNSLASAVLGRHYCLGQEVVSATSTSRVPVSVVVMTKNEEENLPKCLASVVEFDEVFVVDSRSEDRTQEIARAAGVEVVEFVWHGRYPKKKQWCLENLPFRHDFVLYLDADEELTTPLVDEVAGLAAGGFDRVGYFVALDYVFLGRRLRHGLRVYKLVLFDRHRARYVERDDLDVENMWEVEGHYQPRIDGQVGSLQARMIHRDEGGLYDYFERHNRYSDWEAAVRSRGGIGRDDETQTARRSPTEAGVCEDAVSVSRDLRLLVRLDGRVPGWARRFPLRRVPQLLLLADRSEDARATSDGARAVRPTEHLPGATSRPRAGLLGRPEVSRPLRGRPVPMRPLLQLEREDAVSRLVRRLSHRGRFVAATASFRLANAVGVASETSSQSSRCVRESDSRLVA